MSTEKPLSLKQAQSCETAKGPTCHCRCGGRLHGANRHTNGLRDVGVLTPNEAFFATLPPDDPHFRQTAAQRKAAKREEREKAQDRKWELRSRVGSWRTEG